MCESNSGRSGLFVTLACAVSCTDLTPASGRQDHTTSPSASGALVRSAIRVHCIPPYVRDDRETPLVKRRDGRSFSFDLGWRQNGLFLQAGLERANQPDPSW